MEHELAKIITSIHCLGFDLRSIFLCMNQVTILKRFKRKVVNTRTSRSLHHH